MKVEYTGRQTDVPAKVRALAERKLKKLEKIVGRPLHAHVILTVDRHRQIAEVSVHTPRGVYELRFFFHSGITSSMGEAISSVTIKDKIRKMIEGEDTSRPLSDSRIAELLGADGLPLARRTVAKYREELRIPPSNLRKSVH